MYDTLTDDELSRLAAMLSRHGHAFYENAQAIANTALYLRETGRIQALDPAWNGFWALREPVVAAMDEIYALMSEVDDIARARRATVTADA